MKCGYKLFMASASSLILAASPSQVEAAGFYIQEQSVSGLGSAFAGQVATPRDSSIVYFNPAGMTHLKGTHAHFGAHILSPSSKLTDTGSVIPFGGATGGSGGNPYSPTAVPSGHISHEFIEDALWIGVSVSAPFGLSNEYNDGWFGRFDSTKTSLKTIDVQPSFAYKVSDTLSIGGGINIQTADADLQKVINQGAGERDSKLLGDDQTIGYNFGLIYSIAENTTIGAHYRSGIHHNLRGKVQISNAGVITTDVDASAELDLPEIIQIGVNHSVNDRLSVQAGATWFGWNSFEAISVNSAVPALNTVTTQNYQTTWALNVGAEYKLDDSWTVRAGYQFDETPTTDEYRTTLTPDGDRHWVAAGTTYTINDKFSLDMAATYIDISNETINVSRNGGLASVQADSNGHVGILSLGMNYKF